MCFLFIATCVPKGLTFLLIRETVKNICAVSGSELSICDNYESAIGNDPQLTEVMT